MPNPNCFGAVSTDPLPPQQPKARQFIVQPPGFPIFTDSSGLFSFFILFVF